MAKRIDFKKIAMKTAGLGAGGVGAGILESKLPETMDAKIRNLVLIAAGTAAPLLAPKQEMLTYVGDGMVAVGASNLAKVFMPNLFGADTTTVSGPGRNYVAGRVMTISDYNMPEDVIIETPGVAGSVEEYTA